MDSAEYIYFVVQFLKRGRPGTRSIDIIPSKWTSFDYKKKKLTSQYMEPPYTEENIQLLHSLIESNAEAPPYWKPYNVKIVARASKFFASYTSFFLY